MAGGGMSDLGGPRERRAFITRAMSAHDGSDGRSRHPDRQSDGWNPGSVKADSYVDIQYAHSVAWKFETTLGPCKVNCIRWLSEVEKLGHAGSLPPLGLPLEAKRVQYRSISADATACCEPAVSCVPVPNT